MATEYITKFEAIEAVGEASDISCYDYEKIEKAIQYISPADVRPVVHGEWEHISFMTCRCSVCKDVFHELEGDNFCPNCGTDMRGAQDL